MRPKLAQVTVPVWLGEGPHWDHEEQVLYFVSIFDHNIHKYVARNGAHTKAKLDGMPAFIIPLEGKRHHFVVGLNRKLVEIKWNGRENAATVVRTIAEVDQDIPDNRFNDAKADPRGRLFAGTMGHEYEPGMFTPKNGSLYRFDPDGTARKVADNIDIANGLCWDLENKAFYFIDSFEFSIRRYDYDVETGEISNPRSVFSMRAGKNGLDYDLPGILDGMTIDTHGKLWVANFDGRQVLKINPKKKKVSKMIPIPALQVTSVTFGGPKLDVLYVTTAAMDRGTKQLPPAGAVFQLTSTESKGHPNDKVRFN